MLKRLIFVTLVAPVLLLCINATQQTPPSDVESNYKTYCAGCHGVQMNAFVDRKWKHGSSKDDLFKAIKVGYPDEGMPGFDTAFTDQEITELSDYILKGIANVERYDFKEKPNSNTVFKTEIGDMKLEKVADGMGVPWSMAFLPAGEMLVTERSGKLHRLTKDRKKQTVTGLLEILSEGQGGLMDVILHPNYNKNKVIYLSYSAFKKEDGNTLSTTAIMRATLTGNKLTNQKVIFEALPYSRTRHHYGAKMAFGKDGMLYFSVGDRGNQNDNPQNLKNHGGKIHRIKGDGTIPADNPFVKTPGAMPSIFSYGHRNPQGLTVHPETGAIWTNEHGPRGGDEINLVQKGKNYGWPLISYGINYNGTTFTDKTSQEGMEQPNLYWVPSIGPSGMAFIQGNRYKGWAGDAMVGSLRFEYLNRCNMEGTTKIAGQENILENIGRLRDVRMAPDGYIYIAVEDPGTVYKLVPVVD